MYKSFQKYKKDIFSDDRINKLIFEYSDKYYYVYRITDIKNKKYYYGSRSCSSEPIFDLGIKYFSSSSDSKFISKQKECSNDFKYKIIRIFKSPGECIIFESFLHQYFQVSSNLMFYNKSNQSPFGFSITGNKETAKKISNTLNKVQSSGLTLSQESGIKSSKTVTRINLAGQTIAKDIARRATETRTRLRPDGSSIVSDSAKKRLKTILKIQSSGSTIALDIAKKAKLSLSKIQKNGLTGYENYGKKISKTLNIVLECGNTLSELRGNAQCGKNNPKWNGYYITPLGKYYTAKEASICGLSWQAINKICKNSNKKITKRSYVKCSYLQNIGSLESILDYTWNDLGFGFIK